MSPPKPATSDSRLSLVTGATGLLGSHIVELLRQRGESVRVLCRPGSDAAFLKLLGAEVFQGDVTDPPSLAQACDGVDVVFHAAARVGDWGPWSEFQRITIDGTRHLVKICQQKNVSRFIHISSISAYGHIHQPVVLDESAPLGKNLPIWSYYSQAKIEAEKLVWEAAAEKQRPAVTVIRPSWMYGVRDRASLPRLIESILNGTLKIIGDGSNRLNLVNAANVAEACILASDRDEAVGRAYNVCHDGRITQREYFDAIARALGRPPIRSSAPYAVAYQAAFLMECFGKLMRRQRPPLVTRYALWLIARRCFFEGQRIKDELGWTPRISYADGIPEAVRHILGQDRIIKSAAAPKQAPQPDPARVR